MNFLGKLVFHLFSNAIALWVAAYFLKGFEVSNDFGQFMIIAGIFTVINIFLKPVLKLIMIPVIILTLGFGTILINMAMLYVLQVSADKFNLLFHISGLPTFLYATLIIGFVNILLNSLSKKEEG